MKKINYLWEKYKGVILFTLSLYVCLFALSENNKRIDNEQHISKITISENN